MDFNSSILLVGGNIHHVVLMGDSVAALIITYLMVPTMEQDFRYAPWI